MLKAGLDKYLDRNGKEGKKSLKKWGFNYEEVDQIRHAVWNSCPMKYDIKSQEPYGVQI